MILKKKRDNTTLEADGEPLVFDDDGTIEVEKISEDMQALIDENYIEEIKAVKEAKPEVVAETIKSVEENFKNEVEVLTTAIKEMNSKMQVVFKKVELEENDKKVSLSENDKKVADLLGLSHEAYLKSKEESK